MVDAYLSLFPVGKARRNGVIIDVEVLLFSFRIPARLYYIQTFFCMHHV